MVREWFETRSGRRTLCSEWKEKMPDRREKSDFLACWIGRVTSSGDMCGNSGTVSYLLLSLLALVLLSLAAISLFQTLHACLAHLGVSCEEALEIIRLDDRTELELVFILYSVFALALSICSSNKDR